MTAEPMCPLAPVTKTRMGVPPARLGCHPSETPGGGNVITVTDITLYLMSVSVITKVPVVGRWKPDARGRLEQAALQLFTERGYDQTTTAEIAERAGLTERTFFRYFADKREVLFGGASALQEVFVSRVAAAPDGTGPIDAVAAGLDAVAEFLQEIPERARSRQAVIAANQELQERELIKLATLAAAAAAALRGTRRRGACCEPHG